MELNFIFAHASGNEVFTSLEPRPNEDNDELIERARKKCANELTIKGFCLCKPSDLIYLYSTSK